MSIKQGTTTKITLAWFGSCILRVKYELNIKLWQNLLKCQLIFNLSQFLMLIVLWICNKVPIGRIMEEILPAHLHDVLHSSFALIHLGRFYLNNFTCKKIFCWISNFMRSQVILSLKMRLAFLVEFNWRYLVSFCLDVPRRVTLILKLHL